MRRYWVVWVILLLTWASASFSNYTHDYSEDYYMNDDYKELSNVSKKETWNSLIKLLLNNESAADLFMDGLTSDWELQADQPAPGVGNLSASALNNLGDEEIWKKVISGFRERSEITSGSPIDAGETEQNDVLIINSTDNAGHQNISFDGENFNSAKSGRVNITEVRTAEESMLDDLLRDEYQSDSATGGPKDAKGSSTLAFVFDTTGSMWDDLVQVRRGAAKIMETMLERPDKPIYDYVLVPFHDPLIGPVTVTTDHELLMRRLHDIQIYGGGDCPEASVEAVLQALQHSRPNSYIYVFTDARAKDYHLLPQVLPLIQRKQSQVVFVMTGDCGDQTHAGYQVYHKIAATSSGQVYHLNKSDVDEVLSFVRVSLQSRKVNLLSMERPPAQNGSDLPLPIDETLKEFTVSVSGSNASIGVVDPGGRTVQPPQLTPLLDLQNVKVVNVKEPPPGMWTLQVGSDSSHTVRSTGLSGSDFVHGFSVIPTTNMAETYHRPLQSGYNSVLIRATEPDNLYNLTKLELIHLNGSVADVIVLCSIPDQPGLYSGGPFIPPNEFFYLSVSGFGKDTYPVKRITATAISAQPPELPTVTVAESYIGRTGHPLKIVCRVESLVPFTVRWFKDGASKSKPIIYNQTADVLYEIASINKKDAGKYICKVQIPTIKGSVFKSTNVLVTGPPPHVVTQKELVGKVGLAAELTCSVASDLAYNISWKRFVNKAHRGVGQKAALQTVIPSPRLMVLPNNSLYIISAEVSDEGWYSCSVFNEGGHGSDQVFLLLQEPPAVKVTPTLSELSEGAHFSIQCQVLAGIPYPSITWWKNNRILQDIHETNDNTRWTLNVRNIRREDEGIYTCEARNLVGNANGTSELIILELPSAKIQPESALVKQGDAVELLCKVSGTPIPQITWYKDSKLLPSDGQNRFKITKSILKIEKTNLEDAGLFTCVARNKVGTAKDSINVQIGYPPRIVHLPSDLSVPIGGSASMLCAAVGIPEPITSWDPLKNSRMFSSEQGEFFIKDAQLEDEGNYTCTVQNMFGKAFYSIVLRITGIISPKLLSESMPPTMKTLTNRTVHLPCHVIEANPPPLRTWYKDGVELDPSHYHITTDGTLLLEKISTEDKGDYKCVVSNVGGQDVLTTTLHVLVPPKIIETVQNGERQVVEGSSLDLPCNVIGDPSPNVSWLRHGRRLPSSQQGNSSLQLSNVTVFDAGIYTCLAISPAGSDSRSVMLHVLVPPKITRWKENVTVSEGHYTHLECHVTAVPAANISWYHENQLLPYQSSIIRFPVNKTLEGLYKCVAENEVGSSVQLINLLVSVVPRINPLTSTKFVGVAGEDVTLYCPASGDPKPTVSWSRFGSPLSRQVHEDGSVVLTDLTPADAGMYLCSASNIAGSATLPVSLHINVRPVITDWEADISVMEGEEVILNCVAEGVPPVSVTWLQIGHSQPLPAHGSSYKFTAEQGDSGNYTCVAENEVGKDSQNLTLTVVVPAHIQKSDEVEKIHLFNNISEIHLSCQVNGVPPPIVTWFKDSVNLTEKPNNHFRINNNVITIINATEDMAGQYLCHAENIAGLAQKIFKADFYESPKILEQIPTNITLRQGDDYTIPCSATGVPSPLVFWKQRELTLPQGYQNDEIIIMEDKLLLFTQVTSASDGSYSCVAVNPAGQDFRNYTIQVIAPPIGVDSSVTQVEIIEENSGHLTCPINQGSFQATIQWLKDGVPIKLEERADDTHYILKDGGRTLKIEEARSEDGGIYTCITTNLAGRSQASYAVEVLVHPHFIEEFPETEIQRAVGERLVLNCSVGGNPEPKITWKRVELGLPVTQHTTPGMMLELPSRWRLIFPAVQPHHSGTYQCSAVNKLGRDTRKFVVRVTAPPEIEGPKEESVEASVNETVILQCKVWGTPNPVITWDYSKGSIDFSKIQNMGFDLRVYELPNIDISQAGYYRCTAENILGSVSKLFNVTISEPPRIKKAEFVEELKVSIGGELKINCYVFGSPSPLVSWLHNGHVIDNPAQELSNPHTLTLSPVGISSGGKYSCIASNKAGVVEKTFKVKVLVPPRISESYHFSGEPKLSIVEGLPLTVHCPFIGTPTPNFTWLKDEILLNETSDTLLIPAVKLSDRGDYTCTATNHVGTVSKKFAVEIHKAPEFKDKTEEKLEVVEVLNKGQLQLSCEVAGHPTPTVMWLKGTKPLLHVYSDVNITNSNQTMIVKSVGPEHAGQYLCLASNIVGTAEKSFTVQILEPPSIMGDEAKDRSPLPVQRVLLHRKIFLECPVSGYPPPSITWYKDGAVLLGYQVSEQGRFLHIMNALQKHGGNYSCIAENSAGITQLFLPVSIVVPMQWSEWTLWTECSKSCGGGKEMRERQCGNDIYSLSVFVEFDTSQCLGDKIQSRPCNVQPCQVHGSWSEWTGWTSCSESCGYGTRRRYRRCDSPAPALGGDYCLGSDGQQETCIIQPCPIKSHWSEWTEWSRCSKSCGSGTKFRGRHCLRGDEISNDCLGEKQELIPCSNRKCPVNGKWTMWGAWSHCSTSCGRGLRQRYRLCSKPLYGGKPCSGDNIQIENCHIVKCNKHKDSSSVTPPKSASLHIRGELNGERVDDMYLDANIREDGPKRMVTATLEDILKTQANWFPYLTFLMPPVSWNTASEREKANNGYSLTSGNFTEESRFQFATGHELVVKHKGKGVNKQGALKVDIEVMGEVPTFQPMSSVVVSPYSEDYIQTGPNSLYTSSKSSLDIDGEKLPFAWNRTVVYDGSRGTMPYLVEHLSTDEISSEYSPKYKQLNFKATSEISKKYPHDTCPVGFQLDVSHQHCSDIDECAQLKNACHQNQMCENQFGSYRCICQSGYRISTNGGKCVDINECEETRPCSHNCHNIKGSFYCSCPPQLALSHTGLTCKAWGDLDMEEITEDEYEDEDITQDEQFLEAKAIESVACRPGYEWKNNSCHDVDECIHADACNEEEICINTEGSHQCIHTPCINSNWDHVYRSCVRLCDEWSNGCTDDTMIAEFNKAEALKLKSGLLQPYQDLIALQPTGLQGEVLGQTVYDITLNKQDVPLRIRIEQKKGILYAVKHFQLDGINRLEIKATSFTKDYKTQLYKTIFTIYLYPDELQNE